MAGVAGAGTTCRSLLCESKQRFLTARRQIRPRVTTRCATRFSVLELGLVSSFARCRDCADSAQQRVGLPGMRSDNMATSALSPPVRSLVQLRAPRTRRCSTRSRAPLRAKWAISFTTPQWSRRARRRRPGSRLQMLGALTEPTYMYSTAPARTEWACILDCKTSDGWTRRFLREGRGKMRI